MKFYCFSCSLQQICYLKPFFKNSWSFLKKPTFYPNLLKLFELFEKYTISISLYSKVATFSRIWWIKFFSRNPFFFFQNCSNFSKFLRNLSNTISLYSKFATFSRLWWINFFFRKTLLFFQNCSFFSKLLRNLSNTISLYSKVATFSRLWWIKFFSRKLFFFSKTAQVFRIFWATFLILSHSTVNLLPLQFLKKSWFYFKNPLFILKNPIT